MIKSAATAADRDRTERAEIRDQPVTDPTRRDGEELALVDEIGREEDDQQQLRDLDRLELERGEVDPQPRPVDVLTDARKKRRDQQEERHAEGDVAVPLEISAVVERRQHRRVDAESNHRPSQLQAGLMGVASLDEDVPDPVQDEDDGHHHRVRVRRVHAVHHLHRDPDQRQEDDELDDVVGELAGDRERLEQRRKQHDDGADHEQTRFGAATRRPPAQHGDGAHK